MTQSAIDDHDAIARAMRELRKPHEPCPACGDRGWTRQRLDGRHVIMPRECPTCGNPEGKICPTE